MNNVDSFLHKGLRNKLVETLREKGITDEIVLTAIAKIPRHLFIEDSFDRHAYEDKAFSIGGGQTISQPYTVAFQSQLLNLKKNDKVLEIGTGSGYQTAVLIEMGANVFTIERKRELFLKSQNVLHSLNYFPHAFLGDGYNGKPIFAPFNKIIVTAGAAEIPQKLLTQLAVGGRMVIPVGEMQNQQMIAIDRISDADFKTSKYGTFSFVPLLKGVES